MKNTIMRVASLEELYEVREYCEAIVDQNDGKILNVLQNVSGWRGLFDSLACEFKGSTLQEKWETIQLLKESLNCYLDGLVYLVAEDWNKEHTCHKLDGIALAIHEYAAQFREAEEYLMRCHHPIFQAFNKQIGLAQRGGWKKAIAQMIDFSSKTVKNEHLGLLLLDTSLPPPNTQRKWESNSYNFQLPSGWGEGNHQKFLHEFFDGLSEEEAKWEGYMGGETFMSITPKLATAMQAAEYKLEKS